MQKTLIIFANSIKHSSHCVAGKCVATNAWIRPVANDAGKELNNAQVRYTNPYGTYTLDRTLQKMTIDFVRPAPLRHQPENWVTSSNAWTQQYAISPSDVRRYTDKPKDLWGLANRVRAVDVSSGSVAISQSLYLIEVCELRLYYHPKTEKRRAAFKYNAIEYDLSVTDPKFDEIVRKKEPIECVLCVSLGEEFGGHHYKLVAGIF